MKKLLISISIIILIAITLFFLLSGVSLGSIQILSISGMKEKSRGLEEKIQSVKNMTDGDYQNVLNDITTNIKKLSEEKEKYDNMVALSSGDTTKVNQLEQYEMEYLWAKLGNHATSEGVIIKIEVVKGINTTDASYNLNFTVNGTYLGITDFIYDIENDSSLGFKIENFKLLPTFDSSGNASEVGNTVSNSDTTNSDGTTKNNEKTNKENELQATFTCKDIAIKDVKIIAEKSEDNNTNNNSANNNSNNNSNSNANNNSNSNSNTNSNNTNSKNN